MKKNIAFLILSLALSCIMNACNTAKKNESHTTQVTTMDKPTYQLFATQNMWNFIKLNTINGKMWIVQYSVNGEDSRFQSTLNEQSLLSQGQTQTRGRFTLVPTSNMWNFILLDQIDGKQWQVQWTTNGEGNMTIPIK
ncbi:MAG: hypothetical protein NC344_00150 [Bacteroidales bacterium]|nr:hypothetical protein [Bacteroidales bacterium]MCM1146248.1 hypothetical protein [Bacteroidales bacterium]MCM1205314.1 hypothetical protein [Bacillota bacterium]MCM1509599.1 hypothetical protein [Clostridium sp.]